MKFVRKNIDNLFLGGLSILAMGIMFAATAVYGPGIPTDSAWYLSSAESLLRGQGLLTFDAVSLTSFPPLYVFLLTALSWALQADVLLIGWCMNGLLLGVNVFLSGLILKEVFSAQRLYFYAGLSIIVLSPSFIRMHASLLTEPLFVTLMLLSIFIARAYLENKSLKLLILLGFLAALAPLLRYIGLSFILSGAVVLLWVHGKAWRSLIPRGLLFGLIASLPFLLWSYFYNYLRYGGFLYPGDQRGSDFWVNFSQAIRKIFYWFVPYRPWTKNGVAEALIAFLAISLLLLLLNRRENWQAWLQRVTEPLPFLSLAYAGLYFFALAATANTPDHYSLISDRYYAAILFAILLLFFISGEKLLAPHLPFSKRVLQIGALGLFLIWLSLPGVRLFKYLQQSRADGENGYNLYNTRAFHESELISRVQQIVQTQPGAYLYSNIPAAVWLFTRQTLPPLPNKYQQWTKDEYEEKMAGWPYDKPGYVIWFQVESHDFFYAPADLALIADLQLVSELADGTVYDVSARK